MAKDYALNLTASLLIVVAVSLTLVHVDGALRHDGRDPVINESSSSSNDATVESSSSTEASPGRGVVGHEELQVKLQRLQKQRRLCAKCDCYALRRDARNATQRVALDENLDDVDDVPDGPKAAAPAGSPAPPPKNDVLVINCTGRLLAEDLPRWSWPARLSAGEAVATETWSEFRGGDLGGVSRLPQLPFHLTRLSLAENQLRAVASRAFANLAALRDLDLHHNVISDVPHDAFQGLASLERLNLSENNLGRVPLSGDLFRHLQKLKRISFAHNHLGGDLNANSLPWSDSLQELDLAHNDLTGVSAGAWLRLPNVKDLNLSHNKIHVVTPNAFAELRVLERLDMSWNALESLPASALSGLASLRALDLSHNALHALPSATFGGLLALDKLDLSWNALPPLGDAESDSSAVLGALPASLRWLDLSHNKLGQGHLDGLEARGEHGAELPPGLEELRVENCSLQGFQAHAWGGLRAVRRLQLADNDISVLSDLARLEVLAELNASRNSLTRFPTVALPMLQVLDVSQNQLERAPSLSATLTPRLARLLLDGNPVEELRVGVPPALELVSARDMPMLARLPRGAVFAAGDAAPCLTLIVRNNPVLVEVEEGAFADLRLCRLDLSYNALPSLPATLTNWTALEVLDLQGNPWACSCKQQWMLDTVVRLLYRTSPALLDDLRCGSPSGVAGRRLVHWFNHTGRALCDGELMDLRSAGMVTFKLAPSTLGVIVALGVVAVGLVILGILAHRKYIGRRRARNRRL